MNRIERQVRRVDAFQRRHPVVAFPWAVIQKFGNDRAGALASQVAYQGLFSLFPLLLLLTTGLGFLLGGHPDLRHQVLASALADFPIIGTQLKATSHPLRGSGVALAVGAAGTAYGAIGVGRAMEAALNAVWNVPYVRWPNVYLRQARAAVTVAAIGSTLLASGGLSILAGDVLVGAARPLAYVGSVALTLLMFTAAFMLLTAAPLGWRDVFLGAALATVAWQALQLLANWYVTRTLSHAGDVYGFFAIVIALLSWLYLAAQLTLLAAEVNVVHAYRLWPRSITQPPLLEGDRRTFARLAAMEVRRPEYEVQFETLPAADEDPLEADGPD